MDEKKAFKISDKLFSVVHFLELPHDDINKTVCVPRKWGNGKENKLTHIKYPIEDAFQTEIRVRKKEKPSKNWGTYEVVELFVAESYEAAESEIAKRNKRETAKKKKYASKVKDKDTKKLGTTMKAQTKKRNITKEKMYENIQLAKKYQQLFGGEDDPKKTNSQTNFNEGYSTSNNTQNGQAYFCKEYPGVFSNPWHNQNCFYKPRLTEGFKIYINGIDVNTYPHISVHIVPTIIEPCNHNNLAQIPPQYCQNFNHLPSGLFIPGPPTHPVFNQGIRVQRQINEENHSQMRKEPSSGQMTEKTNNRNSSYTQTDIDSNVSQQVQTNRTSNSESQTGSCATNIVAEKTNNRNSSYTQTENDSNVSQQVQTNKTSNSESQTESCLSPILTDKTNNRNSSQTENDSNQISERDIQNKRKNKSHTASTSTTSTSTEFNSRQNPENGMNNGERRSETPVNRQPSTDKISSQTPTPLNSNPLQSQSTSRPTVRENIPDNTKNKLPHQRRISSNTTPKEQTQYIRRSSTSQAGINISRNSEEQIRRNEGNKLPMHGQYNSNQQTDKHVPSSRYNTHAPPVQRVENNRNSEKGPTQRKSYSTLPSNASETQANLSPRPVERERDTCNPQFQIHDTTIRKLGSNNKRKSSGVESQTCDAKRVQIVARAQPTKHAGQDRTNTNARPMFPPPLIEITYSPRLKVNGQPLSENRHSNQRKDVHEKANEQSRMHVQSHCNVNQKEVQGNAGENNNIRIVNSYSVSPDVNEHFNHEEIPPASIQLDLQNYRTMGQNLFSQLEPQIYKRT